MDEHFSLGSNLNMKKANNKVGIALLKADISRPLRGNWENDLATNHTKQFKILAIGIQILISIFFLVSV